jgi:hypothetical protein
MKATKIKSLVLSGVILMATSLITCAQTTSVTPKTVKQHKSINNRQIPNNQAAVSSENSIFVAGSRAQVRHDRTGSLWTGGAGNVGKNSYNAKSAKPSKELNGIEQ